MSIIEASVTIDLNSSANIESVIAQINDVLQSVNGKQSQINITDTDNPIYSNPLNYRPGV